MRTYKKTAPLMRTYKNAAGYEATWTARVLPTGPTFKVNVGVGFSALDVARRAVWAHYGSDVRLPDGSDTVDIEVVRDGAIPDSAERFRVTRSMSVEITARRIP
jgi:hypothetical protein